MNDAVSRRFGRLCKHLILLVLLCALPGCAPSGSAAASRRDVPATELASHYPSNDALRAALKTHAEGGDARPRQNILMTTWFATGDAKIGNWCTVDPIGHVSTYRFVHDWGFQAMEKGELTEIQQPELKQLLATLPPSMTPGSSSAARSSATFPPIEDLLLISFRRADGQWVTRGYDRANLPQTVAQIFELTGAPLGGNDQRR